VTDHPPLRYGRAINTVFNKQRGLALGVALSGAGVAATFGPAFISSAIDAFGWRGAYYAMALFTLIVGMVIVIRFIASQERHSGGKYRPPRGARRFQKGEGEPHLLDHHGRDILPVARAWRVDDSFCTHSARYRLHDK